MIYYGALQRGHRRRIVAIMSNALPPFVYQAMADVRTGVDDVDRRVVAMLQQRFGYKDAAARFMTNRTVVSDQRARPTCWRRSKRPPTRRGSTVRR